MSYVPPFEAPRIIQGLKPGGIVMFEGPREWFPDRNGLLKAFEALRILHYEDVLTDGGDFFKGQQIHVLRMVGEKP